MRPAAQHPAVVHAWRDVEDARAAIPRQMVVALAVGVVGEKISEGVEVAVVGIAEAVRDDLGSFSIRREADDRAAIRILHRRTRARDVRRACARVVAANHVIPAVRPFDDTVGGMLAVALGADEHVGLAVPHAVASAVVEAAHAIVAGADEIVAVEIHSVRAGLGEVGEDCGLVRCANALGVVENLDPARARDDHAAVRINRHRVDIVRERVVRVERNLEALGHAKAVALGGMSGGREREQAQQRRQNAATKRREKLRVHRRWQGWWGEYRASKGVFSNSFVGLSSAAGATEYFDAKRTICRPAGALSRLPHNPRLTPWATFYRRYAAEFEDPTWVEANFRCEVRASARRLLRA